MLILTVGIQTGVMKLWNWKRLEGRTLPLIHIRPPFFYTFHFLSLTYIFLKFFSNAHNHFASIRSRGQTVIGYDIHTLGNNILITSNFVYYQIWDIGKNKIKTLSINRPKFRVDWEIQDFELELVIIIRLYLYGSNFRFGRTRSGFSTK